MKYQMNKNAYYQTREFKNKYRMEMIQWLESMSPDAFVTLNFNKETTVNGAQNCLKGFLAKLDRKLLGPSWWKHSEGRTDVIVFSEHVYSNYHFHAVGMLPSKARNMCQVTLTEQMKKIWKSVVPSGSLHFEFITYDTDVVLDYITKELSRPGSIESYISSRNFWPNNADRKRD